SEIGRLFWRHGRSDAFRQIANNMGDLREQEFETDDKNCGPDDLVLDLEKMGPTFVKLGQILSSRADLLPEPYLKALSRLQDKVKPFPYAEVEEVIERELGARISKAFGSFEKEPLAAASLGQVHRATMRDGRQVVIKIQR